VRPRPLPAPPTRARAPYWADFRAGLSFLTHHPVLGPLTLAILLTNAGFIGPMNIGMAELCSHHGWGATSIGVMLTGFALGSAAGALLMTRLRIRRGAGVWFTAIGALQGAAVFATALAPTPAIAAIATAAAGLGSGPMAVISSVLSQSQTPDEYRSRVSGATSLAVFGIMPIASAGTGFAVAALGRVGAYAICGAIEAAALLTLSAPGLRAARLEPA
jgi:MFS family permease